MAEMTQTAIEDQIALIDAQIATLTARLTISGAASLTDYKVGNLSVSGSQRIEQLIKAREMYQGLLEKIPKETADVSSYDVEIDGRDSSELLGDE